MSETTATAAPVHHHTFHLPMGRSKFVAACHQCEWSVTGTQTESARWRQQHESEQGEKVFAYWNAR